MKTSDKSKSRYHIVNYMEELVSVTLNGYISQMPRAKRPSDKIETDIRALALNRLWPMYFTSGKGKRFVEGDVLTDKIDRDVVREVQAAMDIVFKHPEK
jgi:hypothetical protein